MITTAEFRRRLAMTDAEDTQAQESGDSSIKSVVKAAALLQELGRRPRGTTVTELAQSVAMSRQTTSRLLSTLEQTGLVNRRDSLYRLGYEMARLGRLADPAAGLTERVQPILDEAATDLKRISNLCHRHRLLCL